MSIFQDKIQVRQKQMDEIWLNLCSHELKLALVNINDKLKELEKSKDLDTEISRLFYQVCDLFIRHKTELKMNKIVKLQILSLMFFWANQQKFFGIGKLFKSLSRQFVLNNLHEEYTITEINDLYIYAYFDESDLTTDLAIKDRFKYHHQGPLDVVIEVLRMSKTPR